MPKIYTLPADCLLPIQQTKLFYPCAGNDTSAAVKLFATVMSDFHFVDSAYFRPGHQDSRHSKLDRAAGRQPALLGGDPDFELIEVEINGPATESSFGRDFIPCVLTERYQHLPSGNRLNVHRHRDLGERFFDQGITGLGVFFYRGDSQGEGGSGVRVSGILCKRGLS